MNRLGLQVGSVIVTAQSGHEYMKGDELGYFAFGGSTVIALFQEKAVEYDTDLGYNRSPLPFLIFCRLQWITFAPHTLSLSPRLATPHLHPLYPLTQFAAHFVARGPSDI